MRLEHLGEDPVLVGYPVADACELGDHRVVGQGIRMQRPYPRQVLRIVAEALDVLHEADHEEAVGNVAPLRIEAEVSDDLPADSTLQLVHLDVALADLVLHRRIQGIGSEVRLARLPHRFSGQGDHLGEILPHLGQGLMGD